MGQWLREQWNDKLAFKQTIRALVFGIGMAATTAAGGAMARGDVSKVTPVQWVLFGVAVVGGALGGSIVGGDKNEKPGNPPLETDEGTV